MLFFMHFSRPALPFLTPGLPSSSLFLSLTFILSPTTQISHHQAPIAVFLAGESLYIVVSSWIWKPHSEFNVREV